VRAKLQRVHSTTLDIKCRWKIPADDGQFN
jgi:hypothetical protein